MSASAYERLTVLEVDELYRRLLILMPQGCLVRQIRARYPTFQVDPATHTPAAICVLQEILPHGCFAYVNGWAVMAPWV